MQKRGKLINLIKSARINRGLPTISLILFGAALINKINLDILLLSICSILLYAPGGILNAIKDKDYELPSYSKIIVCSLPIIAILISLHHKVILFATIFWIIIGFLYNVVSRKILFLDNTLICITHHFTPVFFSLLLLGMSIKHSFFIGAYVYLVFWFLAPIKNLNGIEKDKKLGYKTLPATYIQGKEITLFLYYISFILMIPAHFIFKLNLTYLILLVVLFLLFLITKKTIQRKNYAAMLGIARLIISLFGFAMSISLTTNLKIILPGASIIFFYIFALIKDLKKSK